MSQTLRKRSYEPEAAVDPNDLREPKRCQREETGRFLDLLQLDQTLGEEEEESATSEELVSEVMRSLEEEIGATCSTSYLASNECADTSAASEICRDHEVQTLDSDAGVDLSYLVDASDYELGIPPSTTLDLKDEICLSPKTSEGLSENQNLKYLGKYWDFEDGFESYQQFALYEDAWNERLVQDYLNTDCISPGMLFDGDFSEAWRL